MRKRSAGAIYERTQRGGAFHTEKGEAVTELRDEADMIARAIWTKALEVLSYGEPSAEGAFVSAQSERIRALVDARLEQAAQSAVATIVCARHIDGLATLTAERIRLLRMGDGR